MTVKMRKRKKKTDKVHPNSLVPMEGVESMCDALRHPGFPVPSVVCTAQSGHINKWPELI